MLNYVIYIYSLIAFSTFGQACFEPTGFALTYAEMEKTIKNSISHRRRALEAMKLYFSNKSS